MEPSRPSSQETQLLQQLRPEPAPDGGEGLPRLRLVLQPGGPAVELTRPQMVVGRHSHADIRLLLPDVSRRHCRFVYTDGVWQVHDLESLNGIFLNGQRVTEAVLHDHDMLGIGGFHFRVEVYGPAAAAGPTADLGHPEGVLQSIADILPPGPAAELPRRKAS